MASATRNSTIVLSVAIALSLSLSTSCQRKSSGEGPVLASVNGEVITTGDFQEELDSLPEYTLRQLKTPEQKRRHLDSMIKEMLLRQEAHRRGLDGDPDIARKVDRYRNRLVSEKLYEQIVMERGSVSDQVVEEYYNQHRDQYLLKEKIRASQILVPVPPGADTQTDIKARREAEALLAKIRDGADLTTLVSENSGDPMAPRGGDLGYFSRGRMLPEFDAAAFSLQNAGDVSEPVRTKYGYHIIQLTDRKPAKQLELEDVSQRIKKQLEGKAKLEIRRNLDTELRGDASVTINEELLTDTPAPESSPAPEPLQKQVDTDVP